MKSAVIGANGQLGSDFCHALRSGGHEVIELNHDTFDVRSKRTVEQTLNKLTPEVVINTAAMHHVESCEQDPVQAFEVNAVGPRNLALACNEVSAVLVHISTDYVFDGRKRAPYVEEDRPQPLNVYATTKLSGEHFVAALADRHFVFRVSGLYGSNPCRAKGHNFVSLMLKLAQERDEVRVVDDEVLAPTCTADVARQIVSVLNQGAEYGLYHAAAGGSCSWYEFAAEIFATAGCDVVLNKARPGEFPAKVPRPLYSVLANHRLTEQGLNLMPHWRDGLRAFLSR